MPGASEESNTKVGLKKANEFEFDYKLNVRIATVIYFR